jgi:hypothetical protein
MRNINEKHKSDEGKLLALTVAAMNLFLLTAIAAMFWVVQMAMSELHHLGGVMNGSFLK